MFIAKLKVLGITVPIGFRCYHDDGFVDSVPSHLTKLAKKYDDIRNIENVVAEGMCTERKGLLRTHIHIFYKRHESENYNLRRRAHEETHALDYFGWLNVLEKRMFLEQGVRINFLELRDDEDCLCDMQIRAELGAIYALKKRGINLDDLKGCPDYFEFAREYYEKRFIK
jgi:hypothetical protein